MQPSLSSVLQERDLQAGYAKFQSYATGNAQSIISDLRSYVKTHRMKPHLIFHTTDFKSDTLEQHPAETI